MTFKSGGVANCNDDGPFWFYDDIIKKQNERKKETKEDEACEEKPGERFFTRLRTIRTRYKNSFTMHGLNHIINSTGLERIFWTLKLIVAVGMAGCLSKTLLTSYLYHETDTVINVETKQHLQFPTVHICNKTALATFSSYANCSSSSLKSYDTGICDSLSATKCPRFVHIRSAPVYHPDVLDKASIEAMAHCQDLGQCVALNPEGRLYQSSTRGKQAMRYTLSIDPSHFPLYVFVKQPADTAFFIMKSYFDIDNVHRFGDYHFTYRKITITRLPSPYTKPSCVRKGSSEAERRNMFTGEYTIGKCLDTCWFQGFLPMCGSMPIAYRSVVKDKTFLHSHYRDRNLTLIKQCKEERKQELDTFYQKCIQQCQSPCSEVNYELKNKRYEPNEKAAGRLRLFFYFQELKETTIEHVPRLDFSTLLANIGGQLSLMAGASAISLVELCVWFVLYLVDRIHVNMGYETYNQEIS